MAEQTEKKKPDDALRKAITMLRGALEVAPNPRVIDGPPALWAWYDGVRQEALELTKEL